MSGYPVIPGVPAAGHISTHGFWHPGPSAGCNKCDTPPTTSRTGHRADRVIVDDPTTVGLLFRCPGCTRWIDPDLNHNCPESRGRNQPTNKEANQP